ncbi:hypothetical protein ONS95_010275 [Cadophora gregata]|uniref:uncharacterized protein n=1 Tax=Cadophora gregata TaxID=51156 RepID=UPI0026DB5136|nr:uncharacterized protein ONS95_010275 [Cadophora gregata]KAK0122010.1 hypothetical protein ONS95_010275 [Cadophora gregata]KAK0127485.1 hypothetical protein ONS96_007022 [Cadophora gregata f. sp. sojae]
MFTHIPRDIPSPLLLVDSTITLASLSAVVVYILLPDYREAAWWLNAVQKALATFRLRSGGSQWHDENLPGKVMAVPATAVFPLLSRDYSATESAAEKTVEE